MIIFLTENQRVCIWSVMRCLAKSKWILTKLLICHIGSASLEGVTIAAILFISLPMTVETVIILSIVMGALWLATVPLTSGVIAYIYGLQYMGTLYGVVFFSHQLGSFVGVWLGGYFYELYGSYEIVWWVGICVGAFSAIIHLPVKEIPLSNRSIIQVN